MKENVKATAFEPHECVNLVQSTKIGTNENKAIDSTNPSFLQPSLSPMVRSECQTASWWSRGSDISHTGS